MDENALWKISVKSDYGIKEDVFLEKIIRELDFSEVLHKNHNV